MKILLIGEFSGVHNNLKKGLKELGHEVLLAADGDGFKNFGYDFRVAPYKGTLLGKIKNVIYIIKNLRKFVGYDVVQFINPFSLPYYYSFFFITYFIFKLNKKSVYYACGTDPVFLASKDKFEYFPFDDPNDPDYPYYNALHLFHYRLFIRLTDTIIPAMYTYALGYLGNPKITNPIPLPGSGKYASAVKPREDKLKILFGITRRKFKGAEYILEALKLVDEKKGRNVEIQIIDKMPFFEYFTLLQSADILIDQCKSYDYGMNAIFAMEQGTIVLSGAEKKAIEYLNLNKCKVINITPEASQIYIAIESLISLSSNQLNSMKNSSINYVKDNHDLIEISKLFEKMYLN